jgi:hypothetical protein
MAKTKTLCLMGLLFFVTSYVFFKGSLSAQKHIDLAHWFNLTGAVLLFSFNLYFLKTNSVASVLTALG